MFVETRVGNLGKENPYTDGANKGFTDIARAPRCCIDFAGFNTSKNLLSQLSFVQ